MEPDLPSVRSVLEERPSTAAANEDHPRQPIVAVVEPNTDPVEDPWKTRRLEVLLNGLTDPILRGNVTAVQARGQELDRQHKLTQEVMSHLRVGREMMGELREAMDVTGNILQMVAKDAERSVHRYPLVVPTIHGALPEDHLSGIRMWPTRDGVKWNKPLPVPRVGVRLPGGGDIDWESFPLRPNLDYPNTHYVQAGYDFSILPRVEVTHFANVIIKMDPCIVAVLVTIPWHYNHDSRPTVNPVHYIGVTPEKGLEVRLFNRGQQTIIIRKGEEIALFYYSKMQPVAMMVDHMVSDVEDDSDEEDDSESDSAEDAARRDRDRPPRTPTGTPPATPSTQSPVDVSEEQDLAEAGQTNGHAEDKEEDPCRQTHSSDLVNMGYSPSGPELMEETENSGTDLVEQFDLACSRAHRSGRKYDTRWPAHRKPRLSKSQ